MSERSRQAADRIRATVPILQVLADYGYEVDPRAEDHEQQFRCDLHGDGKDGKPSARVYPEGGQFFCFACGRSRDVLSLVQEKEGKSFWESVALLEKRWGLPALPWVEREKEDTPADLVARALDMSLTPERALSRLESLLMGVTKDRVLPPAKCAALWEVFDRLAYALSEGKSQAVLPAALKAIATVKKAVGVKEGV